MAIIGFIDVVVDFGSMKILSCIDIIGSDSTSSGVLSHCQKSVDPTDCIYLDEDDVKWKIQHVLRPSLQMGYLLNKFGWDQPTKKTCHHYHRANRRFASTSVNSLVESPNEEAVNDEMKICETLNIDRV